MRILNIIELKNGILNDISSFIISDNLNREQTDLVVEKSEIYFLSKIDEHIHPFVLSDEEREFYLEEAYYEDRNGYELMLSWSNQVN